MTGLAQLPQTDPTSLLRYRDGVYAIYLLTAAIAEFRLFDYLRDHPATLGEICRHYYWHPRPADVLLTLCLCNGYLEQDEDGIFSASGMAREHLCSDSPWDLSGYYASLRDRPVVADYVRVLHTGRPAHWSGLDEAGDDWHGAMLKDEFAKTFTAAMDCRGVYLGKKLADALAPELAAAAKLLDIGGGSGVYACALAANAPTLEAVVLEQAPVDAIAREHIAKRGLADRVSVATGNMFADPWPQGGDLHLFSNVMHDWDFPEIIALLRRSRDALTVGGLVLIHETFLDADKKGPLPVAEYSCILAHSTQGRCYSIAELADALEQTGFRFLGHRPTGGDRSVIVAKRN